MNKQSKIQNPKSKILIVGAGPAGASLAIRLAQSGFEVSLIEREDFPRHKLCGEFISPECLSHFQELGVLDSMLSAGGGRITQTVFYAPNGKNVVVPTEWFGNSSGALSLSRAEMDFRLLEKAREVGVRVLEETQAVGILFEKDSVCGIKVKSKDGKTYEIAADLTIDATGRANVLGKLAAKSKVQSSKSKVIGIQNPKSKIQNQLVGFKTHLENVNLEKNRCEIYFFRGGYGGLSRVENGLANHCFLIKSDVVKEFNGDAEKIVEEVIFKNKRAAETLKEAVPVLDWLAVSVSGFGLKNLNPAANLFSVGDSAAFIDPFTGSGMLMALESAKILADCIARNCSASEQNAEKTAEKIAKNYRILYKHRFQKRLRVCAFMRRAAFVPAFAGFAVSALSLSRSARRILARATRAELSGFAEK
ncbi:MAG: NAD(P)/FAD-dependent oxidoreductase [Acidobacteriota bacterium]|nr:NAD(P)/FAD-dependent oxidoreductase [Acidobacteriota bacterium]